MDRRNGSSDPLRFSFGETRGGSATGDRSGRRGPFGLPARRRRALCMTTVRAFGWPLWNGMCIVTARRGRLPGLSWMRSDEPILFRVSGFCPAVFAVRSGRAGFGRTAGRTGPDSERAIARHSFAPVRARDEKPCSRRSGPGGCADRPVGTGRSRKSIRAARLRLLRRVRWSGARCSGKRRFSVRAEWLRQDTRRCSGGSFRSRRARSAGRRRARPS